jgi:hypothetical protein
MQGDRKRPEDVRAPVKAVEAEAGVGESLGIKIEDETGESFTRVGVDPMHRSWEALSFYHINSAFTFAENATQLEQEFRWGSPAHLKLSQGQISRKNGQILTQQEVLNQHFAYVTGSFFAAVAFLEATINEVFLEADKHIKGNPSSHLGQLPPAVLASMVRAWSYGIKRNGDDGIELDKSGNELKRYPDLIKHLKLARKTSYQKNVERRWSTLNKYQLALYLAGTRPYNAATDFRWKEVELLIHLRNHLTHYKPEWIEYKPYGEPYKTEQVDTASLIKELRIRGSKNELNESKATRDSAVMDARLTALLGASCAVWAIYYSLKFVCEFYRRMRLEERKQSVRNKLERLDNPIYYVKKAV